MYVYINTAWFINNNSETGVNEYLKRGMEHRRCCYCNYIYRMKFLMKIFSLFLGYRNLGIVSRKHLFWYCKRLWDMNNERSRFVNINSMNYCYTKSTFLVAGKLWIKVCITVNKRRGEITLSIMKISSFDRGERLNTCSSKDLLEKWN